MVAEARTRGRAAPGRVFLLAAALALLGGAAHAQIRVKDIADIEGVRENQLVGYGLVVGLNGTGDKLDSAVFTRSPNYRRRTWPP
jgi:flagellar P-ring protein precursor FlgI